MIRLLELWRERLCGVDLVEPRRRLAVLQRICLHLLEDFLVGFCVLQHIRLLGLALHAVVKRLLELRHGGLFPSTFASNPTLSFRMS
jgi:hypothetical protein